MHKKRLSPVKQKRACALARPHSYYRSIWVLRIILLACTARQLNQQITHTTDEEHIKRPDTWRWLVPILNHPEPANQPDHEQYNGLPMRPNPNSTLHDSFRMSVNHCDDNSSKKKNSYHEEVSPSFQNVRQSLSYIDRKRYYQRVFVTFLRPRGVSTSWPLASARCHANS